MIGRLFGQGVVSIAVAVSGVACAHGGTAGIEGAASAPATATVAESKYVVINNTELARGIQIVDLHTKRVGDILVGGVSVVNKYSETMQFQYRFTWYDADGFEVDSSASAWSPALIYGNESKFLKGAGPNKKAQTFKIHIRPF
jgi:uncharacterized protein YcfL